MEAYTMQLTKQQMDQFHEEGYFFFRQAHRIAAE
jgi:hypothetical protein